MEEPRERPTGSWSRSLSSSRWWPGSATAP